MTPEGKVKAMIRDWLNARGAWHFSPSMNGYGRAGIPDFIACDAGRMIAIEAKAPHGKCTPWQDRELDALAAAGAVTAVVSNRDDLLALSDLLSRGRGPHVTVTPFPLGADVLNTAAIKARGLPEGTDNER